jgi:hypothetical protein
MALLQLSNIPRESVSLYLFRSKSGAQLRGLSLCSLSSDGGDDGATVRRRERHLEVGGRDPHTLDLAVSIGKDIRGFVALTFLCRLTRHVALHLCCM